MTRTTSPREALLAPETRVTGPGFHDRVWNRVMEVPKGRVTTYGAIAASLGSPRVARQVGWALAAIPEEKEGMPEIPWHRVINAQGAISHRGDFIRAEFQRRRLEAEGVEFNAEGRCDLKRFGWAPDPQE